MPLKMRNIVLGVAGAGVVAALAVVAFRPDPVPVDLAQVSRGAMQVTIDADGETRIREVYEVAAPVAGMAQRAPVRVGDTVAAGETVVAIVRPSVPGFLDTRSRIQAEAAVREAEASLSVYRSHVRQAEEDLAYARSRFERSQELVRRGVASETRLEDAAQERAIKEAAYDAALSGLEMAESALDRARAALIEPDPAGGADDGTCCVELIAPVDGRVLEIDTISERPVAAGTRLVSVGRPDDLEIVADLLSTDAVRLATGAEASVERWGGEGALSARLRRVEPRAYTKVSALGIEEQRVDAIFDLVSPPEDRPGLAHGFSVFLRIVEWRADDVVHVPLSAVFRRGDGWVVFLAEDGRAREMPVRIGRRNRERVQVLDGLAEGQSVVVHPGDGVADGVRVVDRERLSTPAGG
ncbi:RND transporter [Maritimibacter sp. 55A14]|uniref:efflux RND transporter periplasmic adaptor subunit n=1 Tax=Maritimibacter sp. 55A14 TaxID=2174844 RepID=UPI000D622A1E|nr:HlyD family efflux transporter periplasmic adaptor subunit [Maritimibacter sp. 55A14]PWE31427.1 RND transporter [Maritimibacter sp. 55A14]